MNELALFAGAGGGILGGELLGWRTVCAVEIDAYCAGVLVARQNDGILPPFPIWDDVRTFDGRAWRGIVDIVSGGFPCQDISAAGNGAGIEVENSPLLVSRGLTTVLADLASMGYDARWGIVGADDAGAPHKRKRIWIVANAEREQNNSERGDSQRGRDTVGRQEQASQRKDGQTYSDGIDRRGKDVPYATSAQREGTRQPYRIDSEHTESLSRGTWWRQEPTEIPESGMG